MSRTAFINARLIDPASGYDERGNLLVENGVIADLGPTLFNDGLPGGTEVVDCKGRVLSPGLIDCRVFTGEPGAEHRETLALASKAAAAYGVTTMIVMPNTNPVIDDVALVDFIERRARDTAIVHVHTMAALTKGLEGKEMTEFGLLLESGAVGFTDGLKAVANAQVMRRALSYASHMGALVVQHAEEPTLATGVMNERACKPPRPCGYPRRRRNHHDRARPQAPRTHGWALSRLAGFLRSLGRHHPPRQDARTARHLRRLGGASATQRKRRPVLPHLLQDLAAAPR